MESRIRERLRDLADEAPRGGPLPPDVRRRARRRVGVTLVAGTVAVAAAALGVTEGIRVLARREARPAQQPNAPVFDRVRGWIAVGGAGIVAVDPADPTNRVELTGEPDTVDQPLVWSRDGSTLLFLRDSGEDGTNLAVLHADGSVVRLTSGGGVIGGSLSPDGGQAVFARITAPEEGEPADSLFLVPTTGGTPREIETGGEEPAFSYPAWAPNGDQIVYFGVFRDGPDNAPGLARTDADGTGDGFLVGDLILDVVEGGTAGLSWSPDGSRLAFAGTTEGGYRAIYVVRADGAGLTEVVGGADADYAWPTWSPDGSRIAVLTRGRLMTMNPDGTDRRDVGPADWRIAWNPLAPSGPMP